MTRLFKIIFSLITSKNIVSYHSLLNSVALRERDVILLRLGAQKTGDFFINNSKMVSGSENLCIEKIYKTFL